VAAFEAWLVFLILVVNVVGELQRKRTLASCGIARFPCGSTAFLFWLTVYKRFSGSCL